MAIQDDPNFKNLCDHARNVAMLSSVQATLEWDQQTYLPDGASDYRAEQIAHLSGLVHQRRTAPEIGEWLSAVADVDVARDTREGAIIYGLKREYEKNTKLPQRLVEEIARATALGQHAWIEARKGDDYSAFQPHLETILKLKREQADAIGFDECRYDALLDDYEPEAKTSEVRQVLGQLREALTPLVNAITSSGKTPDRSLLKRTFPADQQREFSIHAAKQLGFDFNRGRLDVTAHPFCTELGPNDCRITTRYDETYFPTAFFGVLHEAGHGLYEQGLRADDYGLPTGQYVSLGVHESQSRLWENSVGRGQPFWTFFYQQAQEKFSALSDVSSDDFFFAINDVEPSLIRVEADEATYNLHIIIRFEMEQALIDGDLSVADAPGAWNEKYEQYLGISPVNFADGILQDVHWSAGLFGYFPTYSLGNLYAAQLFDAARAETPDLESQFEQGEFSTLLSWLRTHVHQPGQTYPAAQLIERATGQPLDHQPLIDYLRGKLAPLFSL